MYLFFVLNPLKKVVMFSHKNAGLYCLSISHRIHCNPGILVYQQGRVFLQGGPRRVINGFCDPYKYITPVTHLPIYTGESKPIGNLSHLRYWKKFPFVSPPPRCGAEDFIPSIWKKVMLLYKILRRKNMFQSRNVSWARRVNAEQALNILAVQPPKAGNHELSNPSIIYKLGPYQL